MRYIYQKEWGIHGEVVTEEKNDMELREFATPS